MVVISCLIYWILVILAGKSLPFFGAQQWGPMASQRHHWPTALGLCAVTWLWGFLPRRNRRWGETWTWACWMWGAIHTRAQETDRRKTSIDQSWFYKKKSRKPCDTGTPKSSHINHSFFIHQPFLGTPTWETPTFIFLVHQILWSETSGNQPGRA